MLDFGATSMILNIETEREEDGRWIAEFPGVMVYGKTRDAAVHRVQALALRVIADRRDNGETSPILNQICTAAPEPAAIRKGSGSLSGPALDRVELEALGKRVSSSALSRANLTLSFAFHDSDEIGPRMPARTSKRTGLTLDDL
jgi:predicted RNase H-like HicB family nuclease